MQLDRSDRGTSSPINNHLIYCKSSEHSPCIGSPNSQQQHSSQISQQILELPLPPPASYNQGYTPDDQCTKAHYQSLPPSELQKSKQSDPRSNQIEQRRGSTAGNGGTFPQVFQNRYQCENFKHPSNTLSQYDKEETCNGNNVSHKTNKINNENIGNRSNCPSVLSTTTLPRSSMSYQVQQHPVSCNQLPPSSGIHPNSLESPLRGIRKGSVSIQPNSHILSHTCHQYPSGNAESDGGGSNGGPLTPLHYSTLGRTKISRRDEDAMKIRRDMRASASDLTASSCDRIRKSHGKNKQESAV